MTNRLDDLKAVRLETVEYPRCQFGVTEAAFAHDFEAVVDASPPLLFCRQCGQVRALEITEENA